jgi:hypothetical protein
MSNVRGDFTCKCGVVVLNVGFPVHCKCGNIQYEPSIVGLNKRKIKRKIEEVSSKITTDCIHLGAKTEWEVACSCPSSTKVPVYHCAKNGYTTIVPVIKRNFKQLPILAPTICCVACEHMQEGYEKSPDYKPGPNSISVSEMMDHSSESGSDS